MKRYDIEIIPWILIAVKKCANNVFILFRNQKKGQGKVLESD